MEAFDISMNAGLVAGWQVDYAEFAAPFLLILCCGTGHDDLKSKEIGLLEMARILPSM
ncbi:hypothetical protein ACIPF8_10140 [Collimonas sp. NPDC087041]|uniref:hypothetical protein n=1 Tax=Collimonas sp. NPDC087041 TaxID=3363960 RepID=UPI00381DDB16